MCDEELCVTFERKVPKSSSFFLRGVNSSIVSAIASLHVTATAIDTISAESLTIDI